VWVEVVMWFLTVIRFSCIWICIVFGSNVVMCLMAVITVSCIWNFIA
jgi:hypothetical protein